MANPDLRDWLAQIEAAGLLQRVSGAERMEEIGGIVDIYQRQTGRSTLLFDDIPGYPRGYRVAANILMGVKQIALTLGLPADSTEMDLVNYWRQYLDDSKAIPPVTVETGAVFENVATGKDINLAKIPTPKWHEDDGGPYIGTGCMVIMKDPDSGWINYGAYRVQVYDDPRIA
ncbi:MAG: UbiD family decarboxylase domain-containing protein, partial [Pseudomonadota bacterium]